MSTSIIACVTTLVKFKPWYNKFMNEPLPQLSEKTVKEMTILRNGHLPVFYAYIHVLREKGWPLRAIAEALDVSRTTVSNWDKKSSRITNVPSNIQDLPQNLPKKVKSVYLDYMIPLDEQNKMKSLTEKASKVRRYTDRNSPARKAAEELEQIILQHKEKGASLSDIAEACGVTRRAVAQRINKYRDQ